MSNASDFLIENGVLKKYVGPGGNVVIPDGVKRIDGMAFYHCEALESIIFPEGVEEIGFNAFDQCENLRSVTMPISLKAIDSEAFAACKNLAQIHISDSAVKLGSKAFHGCQNMADADGFVTIRDVLYGYYGNAEDVTIPDGISRIDALAFYGNTCLKRLTIPNSVTTICDHAFLHCVYLEEVIFPEHIKTIGECVFWKCASLKNVVFPKKLITISRGMFQECTALEKIVIPEGVEAIGSSAFSGCKNLINITIPESVRKIGLSVFDGCEKLASITIPSLAGQIGDNTFTDLNLRGIPLTLPAELTVSKTPLPAALTKCVIQSSDLGYAGLVLYQRNAQWQKWQDQRTPQHPQEEFAHMISLLTADGSEERKKAGKMVAAYITRNCDRLLPEQILKMLALYDGVKSKEIDALIKDMLLIQKMNLKLEANGKLEQCGSGQNAKTNAHEELPAIERFALERMEHRPLHSNAAVIKKGIPYAGKKELCSPTLLRVLLSEYLYLYDQYHTEVPGEMGTVIALRLPENAVISTEADRIAAELDREALSKVLENLVNSVSRQYRPWMYAYGRFATEESVKKLLRCPPSGASSKIRYWRKNLDEALLLSETKAAIEHLEKKGLLEKYTRIHGMSVQEFRDRYFLPKWNMNGAGVIKSAFGRLGFALTSEFGLRPIELATGKELRSVSSKTDPDAAKEFMELKKEAADFYKKRAEYIRSIYITAEHIAARNWRNTYFSNPILRPVTEKVIWTDATGETFMLSQGKIRTVRGEEYAPQEWVAITHVLEMSAERIDAWQNQLAETGKKLLIEQVWEPVAAISDASMYEGIILSKEERNAFKRVLGRKAISVKSENDYSEFDHYANRYVFSDTGTMYVGSSLEISYRVNEDNGETTLCSFRCSSRTMTRELNTILFELGRVGIKSVIRKDAAELLSQLLEKRFTAAQVAEFIRLAQEAGSTAVTAVLLDYKQRTCPTLDPLAEFTLD